jgi:hypothetical protein
MDGGAMNTLPGTSKSMAAESPRPIEAAKFDADFSRKT